VSIVVKKWDNAAMPHGREVQVLCEDCGFYLLPLAKPARMFFAEHDPRGCVNDGKTIVESVD
jgi:hypothetical protein